MNSAEPQILADFYSTPEMQALFSVRQQIQYWLDIEAALARVQARLGVIPETAAQEISRKAKADAIDLDRLRQSTNLVGYPILPLVRQLAALCEEDTRRYIHWGATTQDIMDTATVLQLRAAMSLIEQDLALVIDNLSIQARRHRNTVMAGRTHGQHALPITFGYKVAIWLDELRRHQERLQELRPRLLRCQLGGGVGTLASLGEQGLAIHHALAAELELAPSPIPWHTARDTFAEFVSNCALLCATLGKIANEIATLQQTEFGEVEEPFVPGKGSSSTMPQKRNPILCEVVAGIARIVAQQPPAMLAAMMLEHERAMGEWHIEWDILPRTCLLTSAALRHSHTIAAGLIIHPDQMQRNLQLSQGAIVSEAVMMHVAKSLGHQEAHDRVYEACLRAAQTGESLRTLLLNDPQIAASVSEEELDRLLDPANYLGLAPYYVDAIAGSSDDKPAALTD